MTVSYKKTILKSVQLIFLDQIKYKYLQIRLNDAYDLSMVIILRL